MLEFQNLIVSGTGIFTFVVCIVAIRRYDVCPVVLGRVLFFERVISNVRYVVVGGKRRKRIYIVAGQIKRTVILRAAVVVSLCVPRSRREIFKYVGITSVRESALVLKGGE